MEKIVVTLKISRELAEKAYREIQVNKRKRSNLNGGQA